MYLQEAYLLVLLFRYLLLVLAEASGASEGQDDEF